MNDITTLMATMKAAAEKAGCEQWQSKKNGPGEYGVMVKGSMVKHSGWSTHRPVCDEAVDKKTADFIAAANPANVKALVEALEKAQHDSAVNWEAAASMNVENQELEQSVAELREQLRTVELSNSVLESRPVTVKLPEEAVDQVCLAAAEIHNRGNGVSDDKAQFIINRIRNYLENGGELKGAGIQVIEGEGQ